MSFGQQIRMMNALKMTSSIGVMTNTRTISISRIESRAPEKSNKHSSQLSSVRMLGMTHTPNGIGKVVWIQKKKKSN